MLLFWVALLFCVARGSAYRPVVLMHGVNTGGSHQASSKNPSNIAQVAATLRERYPGIYVKEITTDSGWSSLVRFQNMICDDSRERLCVITILGHTAG